MLEDLRRFRRSIGDDGDDCSYEGFCHFFFGYYYNVTVVLFGCKSFTTESSGSTLGARSSAAYIITGNDGCRPFV